MVHLLSLIIQKLFGMVIALGMIFLHLIAPMIVLLEQYELSILEMFAAGIVDLALIYPFQMRQTLAVAFLAQHFIIQVATILLAYLMKGLL